MGTTIVKQDGGYVIKRLILALMLGLFLCGEGQAGTFEDGTAAFQRRDYATALKTFRKAAKEGHVQAQVNLGAMYDNGQGVTQDYKEAVKWYRKAAEQGNAVALFNLGVMYYAGLGVKQSYDEAAKLFSEAVLQGDEQAAKWEKKALVAKDDTCLNTFPDKSQPHVKGQHNYFDPFETEKYLKPFAEAGDADAQFKLGMVFYRRQGVSQDIKEATKWVQMAAEQGNADAQFRMFVIHFLGEGISKDYKIATRWLKSAAEQGHADAQYSLGMNYKFGQGVPRDYKIAVKWLRKAVEQGHADAQSALGDLFSNGEGVRQDNKIAVRCYKLAAEQGHVPAQVNLGAMYHNGKGVAKNYKEAVKWHRKAAAQGNAVAQFNLGVLYDKGWGVKQDYKEALKWYRKAADQGDASAQFNLGVRYGNGQGVPQDYETSVKWYRKAADQGDASAQHQLGLKYYFGKGVPKDLIYAHMWLNLAVTAGEKDSKKFRDRAEKKMTRAQLAKAQKLAREWKLGVRNLGEKEGAQFISRLSPESLKRKSTGSAFYISSKGRLLTNYHVIKGCQEVRLPSKEKLKLVAVDKFNDLALLSSKSHISNYARFRSGRGIPLGAEVVVAGYPLRGLLASGLTITSGTVSALAGLNDNRSRLQISAPIQKGNSGGPLLDESGNVVGIIVEKLNAMKLAKITGDIPQNVNFAVKATVARLFLEEEGVEYKTNRSSSKMKSEKIAAEAQKFTVSVECWGQ